MVGGVVGIRGGGIMTSPKATSVTCVRLNRDDPHTKNILPTCTTCVLVGLGRVGGGSVINAIVQGTSSLG